MNAQLKKVFVFGVYPSVLKLMTELAVSNPEVKFDYATTFEIDNIDLPNVKVLHLDLYYIVRPILVTPNNINSITNTAGNPTARIVCAPSLKRYLDQHSTEYDLVIFGGNMPHDYVDWLAELSQRVPVLHPCDQSVQLENDKVFFKNTLVNAGIATPQYRLLDIDSIDRSIVNSPVVIKLNIPVPSGHGTWVFNNKSSTHFNELMSVVQRFKKDPNLKIYAEQYIEGQEVSAHFLCNGTEWKYLGAARDYKKIELGDTGINTTSTGCYSPVEYFSDTIKSCVFEYMDTLMKYLNSQGIFYKGIMYLGLIISEGKPYVLELNARPGTPEMISILDTADNSNLLENLYLAAKGEKLLDIKHRDNVSVCVGLLNKEYVNTARFSAPSSPVLPKDTDVNFYRSCSIMINQNYYGFVGTVDQDRKSAADRIYKFLSKADLTSYRYRQDIGYLE